MNSKALKPSETEACPEPGIIRNPEDSKALRPSETEACPEPGRVVSLLDNKTHENSEFLVKSGNNAESNYILVIKNCTVDDFINIWFDYFDLGTDYSKLKINISRDNIMEEAVKFGSGIRLLKQDFFEVLISFIISANNSIPRISHAVEILSELYGKCIDTTVENLSDDNKYYPHTFPDPHSLSRAKEEIGLCRAGFRCKYIMETTAKLTALSGLLKEFEGIDREKCRKLLTSFPGVGPKVADCTLLFSGIRTDVFPVDVWVKRVMEELYFKEPTTVKDISAFADNYFGKHSGLAQQYLFYYARSKKIGIKNSKRDNLLTTKSLS